MLIQIRIEQERQEMYLLVGKYGDLAHPKVIKQSILLDDLINQYNNKDDKGK
ncbi:hypothetical protein B9T62_05295 [Paenibacillus donghaensis]|uniref:Spo0E family sporulation regulatory protein-aspartic acid phosphatase n=2 Tax=Paenibacillus donghaensis TaxID=414771 RepID=A0A2Z2KQQ5_9BACL|nr:hypothetical protein B9T62_05295 [Paenibacillus donghaensis]